MKKISLIFILILSGCMLFSPTRVADKYFNTIYNSDSYLKSEEGTNFFTNLNDRIKEMKDITEPYVTEEQSNSILGGLKLVVTSVIFSIIESDYEFNVKNTEYSLNKLDSDDENKFYDYKIIIELEDTNGNKSTEEFKGVIHLKQVDGEWKVDEDRLLVYDINEGE